MLAAGTMIGGYRVEELVAAGGMGTVYRATQLSLGRVVALKVLSEELGAEPTFRERFRREAVLQAALEHPHIVPVYEAGESPYGLYIAMRLIDGADLERHVTQAGRGAVLALLTGIAGALDAAHAAGLVHRDLKPQNILVARQHAYLADFGLTAAAGLSSMTSAGQFLGTADYVSPEQIRDEEPDARSDVYSFAAVLYRCLTGSVPFPRSTRVAVIYAQLEQQPERPSSIAPELPAALDDVLGRALAKDPAQRHPSAGELIDAVRAALAGTESVVLERAPTPPAAPAARRRETTTTRSHDVVASRTEPRRDGRARRRPAVARRAAIVALAAIALAAVGVLAGIAVRRASASAPTLGRTRPLIADGVTVDIPAAWTTHPAPAGVFDGSAAAAGPASAPAASVAVGLTRGFGPSLVSTALQALPGIPAFGPAVATRTGRTGRLYRFVDAGRRYEILLVPTANRVATAACIGPSAGAGGVLGADCPRILDTLVDPAALPLDPRAAYADALSRVLSALSVSEQAGLRRLATAGGAAAQASAATAIAGAFTAARARLTALIGHGVSAPEIGVHYALRHDLGDVAADYAALAAAARAGDAVAYRGAEGQIVSARGDLDGRLEELTRAGYILRPG